MGQFARSNRRIHPKYIYRLGVFTPNYTEFIPADSELIATAKGRTNNTGYDCLLISNCTGEIVNSGTYETFRTLTAIPENDACIDAMDVRCGSVIDATTRGATETKQEMDLCALMLGQAGIWYTFENTLFVGSEIVFSLCTSTNIYFDSQITVYAGSCDGMECIASNNDSCDILSEISITTDETERYYIYVFGSEHSQGEFELTLTCNSPQPLTCDPTANAAVSNETDTTADMTWDEVPTAFDGYKTYIVLHGEDPLVDSILFESAVLPQTTTSMTATGLSSEVTYDAYIVSICDVENEMFQFSEPLTFNTILGNSTFEIEPFAMFPNPAYGLITMKSNVSIDSLEIYNLLGQVVLQQTPNVTKFSFDISDL